MLATRGWKYKAFLRYLRLFRYAAFSPTRGEFLESYYTLMRYLDDVVDGDANLPHGYSSAEDYLKEKIAFSEHLSAPIDEVDHLMVHCFRLAERFGEDFGQETRDILESLLFDARRKGKLTLFPEKELMHHFHRLDIRGTVRATLKVFKEDPEKWPRLEPLGMACRYQFDLEDFEADIQAGYVNISREEIEFYELRVDDLNDLGNVGLRRFFRDRAQRGLDLLREHHRNLATTRFSILARATFHLVYELPARKRFRQVLKEQAPFLRALDSARVESYNPGPYAQIQ